MTIRRLTVDGVEYVAVPDLAAALGIELSETPLKAPFVLERNAFEITDNPDKTVTIRIGECSVNVGFVDLSDAIKATEEGELRGKGWQVTDWCSWVVGRCGTTLSEDESDRAFAWLRHWLIARASEG